MIEQHRCSHCQCNVNPERHVTGSEDCEASRVERLISRADA